MKILRDTSTIDRAHAYRITRCGRLLRNDLLSWLRKQQVEISPEQYFLLWRLHERDGRPQRELVDPAMDDRANITRLVESLERSGYVHRRGDPSDGRKKLVFLTKEGRDLVDLLREKVIAERERLFAGLPQQDLEALVRVLDHLETTVLTDR